MSECRACGLWRWRRKLVRGSGDVPARLLFIGEGPGKAEDLTGLPFYGPAGRFLRRGLAAVSRERMEPLPTIFITNIVACRPCDGPGADNRAPEPEECIACRPRLVEEVVAARAERVVFLGETAEREARSLCPDGVRINHPAYYMRLGGESSGAYIRFVRELSEALEGL